MNAEITFKDVNPDEFNNLCNAQKNADDMENIRRIAQDCFHSYIDGTKEAYDSLYVILKAIGIDTH